jgi:hypothetical protein
MAVPEIIERYLELSTGSDAGAMAACFTDDAEVTDEGATHRGREEIRVWREKLAATFTYTITVVGAEPDGSDGYRVPAVIEGDFPGGRAELTYRFRLRDGLIAALTIG